MLLPKVKPWRNEKYRRLVASQPCCVPGCGRVDVQCHHEQEEDQGGMGTKAGDDRGTPLCCGHHDRRTRESRAVWEEWGVDPEEVIVWMQREWVRKGGKRSWETVALDRKPARRRTAGTRIPKKCRILVQQL